MTRSTHSGSGATGTTFTLAFIKQAIVSVRQFVIILKNRRAINSLQALDDRMLKDIGLSRADVEGALMLPLSADPSSHLAGFTDHGVAEQMSVIVRSGERRMLRPRAPLAALKPEAPHCA